MGKYKSYPEYKDSGVEWLGDVPEGWTYYRIKQLGELNPSKSEVIGMAVDTLVTFLPMETIGEFGELDVAKEKRLKDVVSGYTYLAEGDVFLAKITPCFENGKGAIARGLKNGIGFATTEVIPIRCNELSDSQFIYYVLHAPPFRNIAEGAMYGAGGQKRVADSFVADFKVYVPKKEEQAQIAAFLDHETAKIDRLIEKQEKLIELFKEKRQAVISHAVTKGLNADAPMKDSGVEWLGEVPEHWEVKAAKRVFKLECESAPPNNDYELLSVYTEIGVKPRKDLEQKGNKASTTDGYWLVRKGDLVVNKLLAWMGAVGYSEYQGVTSPAYDILRPIGDINSKFYHYLFRNDIAKREFKRWSRGIMEMRLRLYFDELGRISMPVPNIDEQNEIVAFIEKLEGRLENLSQKANKQIEFLKERRTALISAAVTGKVDVRDWQKN